eukprot:71934-Prorocentrum_lima.AAC.1
MNTAKCSLQSTAHSSICVQEDTQLSWKERVVRYSVGHVQAHGPPGLHKQTSTAHMQAPLADEPTRCGNAPTHR